jgi:hypothetical protein
MIVVSEFCCSGHIAEIVTVYRTNYPNKVVKRFELKWRFLDGQAVASDLLRCNQATGQLADTMN